MKADVRVIGSRSRVEASRISPSQAQTLGPDGNESIDEKPKSVYEVVTRQMLEQVKDDVNEVKSRVNTLLWLVVGAMLMELLMRLVK